MAIKKIFLSYSRRNTPAAVKLKDELMAHGFNVWMDQSDIELGHTWDEEIKRAIVDADCVLALQSMDASQSENIKDELAYAISKDKLIIPVLLEKCELPLFISRRQYFCLYPHYESQLQKLVQVLGDESFTQKRLPDHSGKKIRFLRITLAVLVLVLLSAALTYMIRRKKDSKPLALAQSIQLITLSKKEGWKYGVPDYFRPIDSLPQGLKVTPGDFLANFYRTPIDPARNKDLLVAARHGDTSKLTLRTDRMPPMDGLLLWVDTILFNHSPFVDLNGDTWFDIGVAPNGKHEVLYKSGVPAAATSILFITSSP